MQAPQEKCKTPTEDEGGATPKKRGRGRPRKAISELLSKSGRRRRRDELTQSSQSEGDGTAASSSSAPGRSSGTTAGGERKRRREGSGERSTPRAKRIKVNEKEEDREEIFDVFPNDEHLFTSCDTDSADSAGKESSSGSDSEGELGGTKLYLKRRRETQLVTGNPMLSYFSLKYTVCLCYLGLLYINQKILLSDLVR
jgi:hypothetical protein